MNTQELARSTSLARLAYNGRDGFPRVIPIGFYWTGERIVVCTGAPWRWRRSTAFPTSTSRHRGSPWRHPKVEEFEQQFRSMHEQMVRISIEPQWARFYDFSAGRLPTFLTNLAKDD